MISWGAAAKKVLVALPSSAAAKQVFSQTGQFPKRLY